MEQLEKWMNRLLIAAVLAAVGLSLAFAGTPTGNADHSSQSRSACGPNG